MKKIRLYLDDMRKPPDDSWLLVKTALEAIELLKTGNVVEISLDHDLGICDDCFDRGHGIMFSGCKCNCHKTGYDVVCWMESENIWPEKISIHTQNIVGRQNMQAAIDHRNNRS